MRLLSMTMSTKRRLWLVTSAFLFFATAQAVLAQAAGYAYKTVKDFKTLASFRSVQAFEASFAGYVQHCLDNTGGGTGGIRCVELSYEMWDRELNTYYGRLMKALKPQEQALLKENQKQWLIFRDNAIAINSALLERRYDMHGTMYFLMRADDASRIMTPMVKQRALMLRDELDLASQQPISKEEGQ
jgi:uncharacterized protein YecT (DUF1311 family)